MQDNFSGVSEIYAKYRPAYPKEMYDFIFTHVADKNFAWDSATGNGQVAVYLSRYFNEVYANDISAKQIDAAQIRSNIRYFNVPSENTGFPENIFNLITVAQAIHWFEFEKYYNEVLRTAAPNAVFAAIGYGLLYTGTPADDLIIDFDKQMFGRYFSENRNHISQKYSSIHFPFKEIKTPLFENKLLWNLNDLIGFFNSWSAVQKVKNEEGIDPVPQFIKNISRYLPENEVIEVIFPVFMRMGLIP